MIEDEWPTEFPGAWQELPEAVQRYLRQRTLEQQLVLNKGPAGLLRWLYAGTGPRADGQLVRYSATAAEIWPLVLEDARAWLAARAKKANHSPTTGEAHGEGSGEGS